MSQHVTGEKVDAAVHILLNLSTELDDEAKRLEKLLRQNRAEKARLVATVRRLFAGEQPELEIVG